MTKSLIFTIALLFSINALSQTQKLNPDQFQSVLKSTPNFQLLDIRSELEFAAGHIKKAVNLDWKDGNFEKNINDAFNKNEPLFVYCQSGNKSHDALVFFEEQGFKKKLIF